MRWTSFVTTTQVAYNFKVQLDSEISKTLVKTEKPIKRGQKIGKITKAIVKASINLIQYGNPDVFRFNVVDGEYVKKGKLLGVFKSGLLVKKIKSPCDGVIEIKNNAINIIEGEETVEVKSKLNGILKIIDDTYYEVETIAYKIPVFEAIKFSDYAYEITIVANADVLVGSSAKRLQKYALKNKWVVVRRTIDGAALRKLNEFGISGVIVGGVRGIEYEDIVNFAQSAGIAVIVVSGLGMSPINQKYWKILSKSHEQLLSCDKNNIFLSIRLEGVKSSDIAIPRVNTNKFVELGDTIILCVPQHWGETGTVVDILDGERIKVKLENDRLLVLNYKNAELFY